MTGRTNYTAPTNGSPPEGPKQMTEIYQHFDGLVGESRPTVSALPSADNWPGRTILVEDSDLVYVWTGVEWTITGGLLPYYFGKRVNAALNASASSQAFITSTVRARGVTMSGGVLTLAVPGIYQVFATVDWTSGYATGQRNLGIDGTVTVLGNEAVQQPGEDLDGVSEVLSTHVLATAGATLRPYVVHNSGLALQMTGNVDLAYRFPA
jgi:hypothetical protein